MENLDREMIRQIYGKSNFTFQQRHLNESSNKFWRNSRLKGRAQKAESRETCFLTVFFNIPSNRGKKASLSKQQAMCCDSGKPSPPSTPIYFVLLKRKKVYLVTVMERLSLGGSETPTNINVHGDKKYSSFRIPDMIPR